MKKALLYLSKAETGLCIFMFVLMSGCCIFQVINRNILMFSIGWPEELARFSMIWMALLGSEIGLRHGKQMCVEAVVDSLPFGIRKIVEILGDIACALFAGIAGWYSIDFIKMTIVSKQVSTALTIPMWIVYLILPITLFSMCGYEIYRLIFDIRKKPARAEQQEGG